MEGAFETTVSAPSEPVVAPPLAVWQRPAPAAIAALASFAIGGFAVWSLTRPAPPPPGLVSRFSIPLASDQFFDNTRRLVVAISPTVHTLSTRRTGTCGSVPSISCRPSR